MKLLVAGGDNSKETFEVLSIPADPACLPYSTVSVYELKFPVGGSHGSDLIFCDGGET